jgi:hypothetical protein
LPTRPCDFRATAGARPTLHYAIEGSAKLAHGLRVPFRHAGDLGESPR